MIQDALAAATAADEVKGQLAGRRRCMATEVAALCAARGKAAEQFDQAAERAAETVKPPICTLGGAGRVWPAFRILDDAHVKAQAGFGAACRGNRLSVAIPFRFHQTDLPVADSCCRCPRRTRHRRF